MMKYVSVLTRVFWYSSPSVVLLTAVKKNIFLILFRFFVCDFNILFTLAYTHLSLETKAGPDQVE